MNQHKYACPHCGQHMEYTDEYCGMQMACPKCQQPIVFPGLAAPTGRSSLRLAGAVATERAGFRFDIVAILLALRKFKHWKIVAMCLIPFVVVAGALVAASKYGRHEPPPAPPPVQVVVDPRALANLTDLTRADQMVQEELAAVKRACADSQAAEQKQAALNNQPRGTASRASLAAADQAVWTAHLICASTRKEFDAVYAQYQKLGGAVDYRARLP